MTVLVVGNATVDVSYDVARLPRPGETLLAEGRMVDAGGKGLNQAVMALRAGADTAYLAPIGLDDEADVIRRRLAEEGLGVDGLDVGPGATDQSIIWVDRSGENVIVSTAESARRYTADRAAAAIERLGAGDILLMQGNLPQATTRVCLERARARGARTMLNPAPIHFDYQALWPLVSLVVLNRVECQELAGTDGPQEAAARLRRSGASAVVVTRGAEGAWWSDESATGTEPAPRVAAVDTTGAGDVFCGVLAARLHAGAPLAAAVRFATSAAALSVTRRGVTSAFPTRRELAALAAQGGPS